MTPPMPPPPDNANNNGSGSNGPHSNAPQTASKRRRCSSDEDTNSNDDNTASSSTQAQRSLPPSPSLTVLRPQKKLRSDTSDPHQEGDENIIHPSDDVTMGIPPVPETTPPDNSNEGSAIPVEAVSLNNQPGPSAPSGSNSFVPLCQWGDCNHISATKEDLLEHIMEAHNGITAKSPKSQKGRGRDGGFPCHWRKCDQANAFEAWSHLERHAKVHCKLRAFICETCAAASEAAAAAGETFRPPDNKGKRKADGGDESPRALIGKRWVAYEFYEVRRYNEHMSLYHQVPSVSRRRKEPSMIPSRSRRFQQDPAEASGAPGPSSSSSPSSSTDNTFPPPKSFFACSYDGCTMKYVYEGRLNDHIDGDHKGVCRWECRVPDCGKKFPHSATLQRHLAKDHTSDEIRKAKENFVPSRKPPKASTSRPAKASKKKSASDLPAADEAASSASHPNASASSSSPPTLAQLPLEPSLSEAGADTASASASVEVPPSSASDEAEAIASSPALQPTQSALQPPPFSPPHRLPSGMEDLLSPEPATTDSSPSPKPSEVPDIDGPEKNL
ncbi:hypothetical protein DFQ27_001447 [Actinomortierella ambigua]|uniref:C2H2-type domain-containing protein n=1 Tax=Actinomortierella ambigua TaxID=1343610 RepID=A0A9P6QEB8_9FUNG|nr:hypothetical protein DFQ27_001447 [Actinomortierella ambigua]